MNHNPLLGCKFHPTVPAVMVAPQFTGGDDNVPATWVPICEQHVADWYRDCSTRLPMFTLYPTRFVPDDSGE